MLTVFIRSCPSRYCTGGIRCERATALLNQITDAEKDFKTKDVVMVRGGIERYLKTFKQGGYWKGKNYLFDKRMEQTPSEKSQEALASEIDSKCCLCQKPCSQYRGQHKCSRVIPASGLPCAVPVIVCIECQKTATDEPQSLACPLCINGYQTPETVPDLVGQKRKLGLIEKGGTDIVTGRKMVHKNSMKSQRLFVGKLPLTTTASKLREAFGDAKIETIQWIVDHETKAFYGSVFCKMASIEDAVRIESLGSITLQPSKKNKRSQKKARISFAALRESEIWPSESYTETEFPPIGF